MNNPQSQVQVQNQVYERNHHEMPDNDDVLMDRLVEEMFVNDQNAEAAQAVLKCRCLNHKLPSLNYLESQATVSSA